MRRKGLIGAFMAASLAGAIDPAIAGDKAAEISTNAQASLASLYKAVAYYSTSGASFGLQAGGQTYGYAMFFMNDKALQQLDAAKGFEVGPTSQQF